MTPEIISGLIGVVGGVVVAIISLRRYPSRITTDAISLVDAFGKVKSNLTEEIDRLEKRLDDTEEELDKCKTRCNTLDKALRDAGIEVPRRET